MTKPKLPASLIDARILAIYQLDQFVEYIRTVKPELKPEEATVMAAVVLHNLPRIFTDNPWMMENLQQTAADVKRKSRNPQVN